jgi:hypothetical protein
MEGRGWLTTVRYFECASDGSLRFSERIDRYENPAGERLRPVHCRAIQLCQTMNYWPGSYLRTREDLYVAGTPNIKYGSELLERAAGWEQISCGLRGILLYPGNVQQLVSIDRFPIGDDLLNCLNRRQIYSRILVKDQQVSQSTHFNFADVFPTVDISEIRRGRRDRFAWL